MAKAVEAFSAMRPSLEYLLHRGPHEIRSGPLDPTGLPGVIFAPETGPRCPLVIFGHGYLQPVTRYTGLLRFLASWGIVAAAPAVEGGLLPSYSGLALDMVRCVDALTDAKIARGRVTIHHQQIAFAGHGIGGGAAVLAAQRRPPQAVVTIAAAPVRPSAVEAAAHLTAPALHLVGQRDGLVAARDSGRALAAAWGGPVQLRELRKAAHTSVAEQSHWTSSMLGEKSSTRTQQDVRTLMAAFLLRHVAGHEQLAEELDGKIAGTKPLQAVVI